MSAEAQFSAGAVVWLTGKPASGKTTTARAVVDRLRSERRAVLWLDSDALRPVLAPQSSYTEAERDWFYGAVGHLAELGAWGGCIAVVSATATKRAYRDSVRQRVGAFVEVWVHCSDTTLRNRDDKGLYQRAAAGELHAVPGVDVDYETPVAPEVSINSDHQSPAQAADAIVEALEPKLTP